MRVGLLTTEFLRKKFKNNFNLCNFAIRVGRNMPLADSVHALQDILRTVSDRADVEQAALDAGCQTHY